LFDLNSEALEVLSAYLVNLDYTGLRHHSFTFAIVKQVMRNITIHRNWTNLNSNDLLTYATAYNRIFFLMFRGTGSGQTGDESFWAALSQDNEFITLLAQISKDTGLLSNPTLGFMVLNAVREISRMAQINAVLPLVEPQLVTIINAYPRLDIKWLVASNALNKYGNCSAYGLCESEEGVKDELKRRLFPQAHSFDDGKMLIKAPLSQDKIQELYYATKQVKSQFFRLLQTDQPVANDPNESLNVIIFGSRELYQDYATYLFGIPSNNGGIYIEKSSTFYTWDRSTGLSLESLVRHEYCHYLQGRYLIPGFWGEVSIYDNSRMVWYEEGMAEFFSGATDVQGIKLLKSNANIVKSSVGSWPSLQTVLASSYSSGNFNHYYFGNMLWYNLYQNDFGRLKRLFDLTRNNDIAGFDNEVNHLRATGNNAYYNFLNQVYAGNVPSTEPTTQWLPVLQYSLASINDIRTEFINVTGINSASVNVASELINRRFRVTGQLIGNGVANNNAIASQSVMNKLDEILVSLKNSNINNFKYLVGYTKNVTYVGGVPRADFVIEGPMGSFYALNQGKFTSSQRNVLVGSNVQFEDKSTGQVNSWSWALPGATPSVSTSSSPTVTYNNVGTYDVSLTTTNSQGVSTTKSERNYINVFAKNNATYCSATVSYDYAYINRVKLGDIDNQTSGYPANGYGDYTHLFTELVVGTSYTLTVVPSYTNSDHIGVSVWIDWNQDGDFDDLHEILMAEKGRYNEAVTSFFIPAHAVRGTATRMRVRLNYQVGYPQSCGNDTYFGEVEDYSVVVVDQSQQSGNAPVASLFTVTNQITRGESIRFENISTNAPTSLHWKFVGGTPAESTNQNPTVTYNSDGVFPVILTVNNQYGTDRTIAYVNVSKGGGVGGAYCTTANTRNDVYIDQVTFGNIVNNTGYSANGYGDFTQVTTAVQAGSTYPLNVRTTQNWQYNQVKVWIDWNQDGDFYDLGEEVLDMENNNNFSRLITIPQNAKLGGTRMRVRLGYGLPSGPQPCGSESIGEVEDYVIFIGSPLASASFVVNSQAVKSGGSISFSNTSAGNISSYSWEFEGGTPATSNLQNPVVTYHTPGKYQVSLVVRNAQGQDTKVMKEYITVNGDNTNLLKEPHAYPNPSTNGKLNLRIPQAHARKNQYIKVEIISLKGEVQKSFSFTPQSELSIDTSGLSKGVYVIRTILDGRTFMQRINIL
jgi:PKD repeat protein